ncbi:MAG: nuclear transport factor 2 family protein [Deltaproteobacteria bacterium]|nr:nuclear transport factor 2 family protein [Deltaproteobacteria bacterium]
MVYDLLAIEEIKRLKYKYMRCLDQKRWEEMAECFVEGATAAYSGGKYTFEGRASILDFFSKAMGRPTVLSSHRVHHPEIDLTSETTAKGTWALEDVFIDEDAGVTVRGAAFYEDQYVKVGGAWKIKHTGYSRTYEEIENRKQMPWLTISQRAS